MSSIFYNVIEFLPSLSADDLDNLKDEINDGMERREHKQVIEFKEKDIKALRDFFNAGGSIIAGGHDYSMIGEDFNLDEPIFLLTYSNLYVIITVVLNKKKGKHYGAR